jgi:hypothetical protein
VNIAFEAKRFPPDGMDDGVTVPSQLGILHFKTLNQLEHRGGGVVLEGLAEKVIETLGTSDFFQTIFGCRQRGQVNSRFICGALSGLLRPDRRRNQK